MDNLGFQRENEVYLKRYTSTKTVCEEVKSSVVNEIVQKELVRDDDNSRDKEHWKGEHLELGKSDTAEETEQAPARRVKKDVVSGKTENEGANLLVNKPEVESQLTEHSVPYQKDFDDNYIASKQQAPTVKQILYRKLSKCQCSGTCLKRTLHSFFPCINILKNYSIRQDFVGDVTAGLTVGIMHIPQGMAYAMLATLSPVYGLYTSFFPVLVYFFFGSSKHISLGTASVVCLMIGSAVTRGIDSLSTSGLVTFSSDNPLLNQTGSYTGNQSETTTASTSAADDMSAMSPEELDLRLQFAMSITFIVGIIQLLMATFRLGFITDYMSDALISGFTTGVACHVFTSQIQNIFSVKLPRYNGVFKLIYTYRDFFMNIGTANYFTVILSFVSAVLLYCTARFINQNPKLKPKMFMPVPIELIVVVLGTVISYFFNLQETFHVAVVSDIPTGLPVPNTKGLSRISWTLIQEAFPIVIVIFSTSISIAKLLAKKNNYEVEANQELLAFGVSTVVCSFLSSVAPMAALSRAVVQERVGGKTQVTGLVSCCLLLVVLLAVGKYFRTTPKCVLAAVIVVALRGMLSQIFDLKRIYDVSKINFFVWIVAFTSTVILDVDLGLAVAVAFNLLIVIYRIQRPYACVLGKMPSKDIYRDISIYQQAKEVPGIKIFRFEQSLFFLNKEHFRTLLSKNTVSPTTLAQKRARKQKCLEKEVQLSNGTVTSQNDVEQVKSEGPNRDDNLGKPSDVDLHTIVIDCSSWSFVDTMGVTCLTAVIVEYRGAGIKVVLSNCRDGVLDMFNKTKFYDTLDHSDIYDSLHDAVSETLDFRSSIHSKQADQGDNSRIIDENGGGAEISIDFKDEGLEKKGKTTTHVTGKRP